MQRDRIGSIAASPAARNSVMWNSVSATIMSHCDPAAAAPAIAAASDSSASSPPRPSRAATAGAARPSIWRRRRSISAASAGPRSVTAVP